MAMAGVLKCLAGVKVNWSEVTVNLPKAANMHVPIIEMIEAPMLLQSSMSGTFQINTRSPLTIQSANYLLGTQFKTIDKLVN